MRSLLVSLFCISGLLHAGNTVATRAGHFWMEAQTATLYTLHADLILDGYPAATDSFRIDWGNMAEQVYAMNDYPCAYSGGGYKLSIQKQHAYAPAAYNIYLRAGKRVPWISNLPNSGQTDFILFSFLDTDPNLGVNSAPTGDSLYLVPPMPLGIVTTIPLNVNDVNGDSVYWMLCNPVGAAGFVYPEVAGGGGFVMYPDQDIYEWDPQIGGLYMLTFAFIEYRELTPGNWFSIGTTLREVLFDAGMTSGLEPDFAEEEFALYPNPAISCLNIFMETNEMPQMNIYDAAGKIVVSTYLVAGNNRVDVSLLAAGMYTVCVEGMKARRLVIER